MNRLRPERAPCLPNPEVCGPAPLSPTAEQATVAGSVSTALMGGLNAEVSHE